MPRRAALGRATSRADRDRCRSNTVVFHLTTPDPSFLAKLTLPSAYAVPPGRRCVPVASCPPPARTCSPRLRSTRSPDGPSGSCATRGSASGPRSRSLAGSPTRSSRGSEARRTRTSRRSCAGSADLAVDVSRSSPGALASAADAAREPARAHPCRATFLLALNTRVAPFDDVRVRRALNFAVDRERLRDITVGRDLGRADVPDPAPELRRLPALLPVHGQPERERSLARSRPGARAAARARLGHGRPARHRLDAEVDALDDRPTAQVRRLGAREPGVQGALPDRARPVLRCRTIHLQLGFAGGSRTMRRRRASSPSRSRARATIR